MNLADGLAQQAAEQPYAIAVIRGRQALTFRDLDTLVWRSARWLRDSGLIPGDPVGLAFTDDVQRLVASLALIRMGAVQISVPNSEPVAIQNDINAQANLAVVLTDSDESNGLHCPRRVMDFEALGKAKDDASDVRYEGSRSAIVALASGSGTTGRAKLIALTAEQHEGRRQATGAADLMRPGERYCSLVSDNLTASTRRQHCAFSGVTIVFPEPDGEDLFAHLNRVGVDYIYLLPVQAEMLVQRCEEGPAGLRLPHLRSLRIAGSIVSERLRRAIRSRLTDNLKVVYGANEIGTTTIAGSAILDAYPGSVGRPVKGVDVEIVGPQDEPLPPGEVGEIRLRSPGMISGYHNDPEATAAAFRDGWFYPRDLGSFTRDGILLHHGRADDMMILDGINVFPRAIELVLEEHPAVAEALAFPIPHAVHQDVPAAAVTLKGEATERELIVFCRARLGVRAPRKVVIVSEFPKQTRGKVLKRGLFRLFAETNRQPQADHS